MKSTLKGYKMIATKSIFAWVKVGVVGLLFSLICIGVAIWLLANNDNPAHSGWKSYLAFSDQPWASALLLCSVIFIIFYILIANKYALQTLIYSVWHDKLADFIIPKIQLYLQKLTDKQPDWMRNITSSAFVSAMTDILNQDGTINKVQRLVMTYGFRRLKMKKKDFEQPQTELSYMVVERIEQKIAQVAEPSSTFFWILFIPQLILLVLSIVFN